MDYYSTRTPDNYSLIKGIFIIIMIAAAIGAILFLTLNINLTTKGKDGQVISENAPVQYLASVEAQIDSVMVKEGDFVSKGDTLIKLYNSELFSKLESEQHRLEESLTNIEIYEEQLKNLNKRIYRQKKEIGIIKRKHNNEKKGTTYESGSYKKQINILENKLDIAKSRINKSKGLLDKGAISEKEYAQRYQEYLDEINQVTKLKNKAYQQSTKTVISEDELDEKISKQKLNILTSEGDILDRKTTIEKEKGKVEQLTAKIKNLQNQLDKLTIISELDGYVTNIFNTQKDVNMVTKKQSLLMVTPSKEEHFYVNIKVPEEEIKDIKVGQLVHVKVNAYNHYQYGVLKARVSFIDKEIREKESSAEKAPEQFYILADIPEEEAAKMDLQNGLKADAEIILHKVKLYKFVMNSMFKKA